MSCKILEMEFSQWTLKDSIEMLSTDLYLIPIGHLFSIVGSGYHIHKEIKSSSRNTIVCHCFISDAWNIDSKIIFANNIFVEFLKPEKEQRKQFSPNIGEYETINFFLVDVESATNYKLTNNKAKLSHHH